MSNKIILSLAKELYEKLNAKKLTISFAESCTGGGLSYFFSCVPGVSNVFIGSLIAYDNEIKRNMLKVPKKIISQKGAVSYETAVYMAKGAKDLFNTDIAIAITGISGPSGGSKLKPVGTVFVAISYKNNILVRKYYFPNKTRDEHRLHTIQSSLLWVKKLIEDK